MSVLATRTKTSEAARRRARVGAGRRSPRCSQARLSPWRSRRRFMDGEGKGVGYRPSGAAGRRRRRREGQGLAYTEAIAAAGRWRDGLATRLSGEKEARDIEVSEAARETASVRGHVGAYLSQREANERQGFRHERPPTLESPCAWRRHCRSSGFDAYRRRHQGVALAAAQGDPQRRRADCTHEARQRKAAAVGCPGGLRQKPDGRRRGQH